MKRNPIKTAGLTIAALAMCAGVTQAQVIDSFPAGESLSEYTETPVLYSGTAPSTTVISFSDASGNGLEADSSTYNNIEQALFLRNDYTLSVGQTLSATVNELAGGTEDFGIVVASTATPTAASPSVGGIADTRATLSYEYIGFRSGAAGHVVTSGFDGSTSIATQQYQPGSGSTLSLFITETALNTFEFGYYATTQGGGLTPEVLNTYTFVNSSDVGDAIGFYTDMRANNAVNGYLDDLTITTVPEPSTLALCGMGLAGLFGWKRRK